MPSASVLWREIWMSVGPEPDVPPYQCFREGPAGNNAKKDVKKNTFEASMCMKTNKYRTKCPGKNRTFMYSIRTFSSNRHDFCRKKPLCEVNLPVPIAFPPVYLCIVQSIVDLGIAAMRAETIRLKGRDSKRRVDLFCRAAACRHATGRAAGLQSSRSCRFATPRRVKVTPHPTSSFGHPLPSGEGRSSYPSLSAGERVAAMRRQVRGYFSEQARHTS